MEVQLQSSVVFLFLLTLMACTTTTCTSSIPQQDVLQKLTIKQTVEDFVAEIGHNDTFESRTFGLLKFRPLKLAIPAIMYKLGVVTTMLGVLTLLSAKSLLVGLIILVIQLSTGFAKFALLKKEHHEEEGPHKTPQNIHVHVHGSGGGYKTSYSHSPWAKNDIVGSKIDEDYYQRLKELKELKDLRESLYTQVI